MLITKEIKKDLESKQNNVVIKKVVKKKQNHIMKIIKKSFKNIPETNIY